MANTPKERHYTMARLYLVGPEGVKGHFERAARQAGFKRLPNRDSDTVNQVVEEVTLELLNQGYELEDMAAWDEVLSPKVQSAAEAVQPDEDAKALEELMAEGATWEEMAPYARKMLGKIGTGRISASAQQVASLKEIIARAEGKVGQQKEEEGEERLVKVVLLPTIDAEMGPVIDLGEVQDVDPGDTIPGLTLRQAAEREGQV